MTKPKSPSTREILAVLRTQAGGIFFAGVFFDCLRSRVMAKIGSLPRLSGLLPADGQTEPQAFREHCLNRVAHGHPLVAGRDVKERSQRGQPTDLIRDAASYWPTPALCQAAKIAKCRQATAARGQNMRKATATKRCFNSRSALSEHRALLCSGSGSETLLNKGKE